jgi:hypothetical protein
LASQLVEEFPSQVGSVLASRFRHLIIDDAHLLPPPAARLLAAVATLGGEGEGKGEGGLRMMVTADEHSSVSAPGAELLTASTASSS